jgi:hypothetical protein
LSEIESERARNKFDCIVGERGDEEEGGKEKKK